jgi:dipeptidyl aminopeptidase/acylaminoacyl peptidase
MKTRRWLVPLVSLIALTGCGRGPKPPTVGSAGIPAVETGPVVFPEFGPSRLIQPGIRTQEATIQRGAMPMRVWYYEPEKPAEKRAVVLVPPAGSTLFVGMALGDDDRTEQYPYVRAGFAVVAFDIDGNVPNLESATDAAMLKGAREFRDARAGLANVQTALDFVFAKVPNLDPQRVYIAGHSSAATLALLAAEHDSRIQGCVAYAPVTDVMARLADAIPSLNKAIPGFKDFLQFSSPQTHMAQLKCPVFLFHASDDTNIPIRQTAAFAALLKKTNPQVTFVTVKRGGHHDSMIREGIPKAIPWLQQLR